MTEANGRLATAIVQRYGERLNAARRRDPIPERTCRTCGETFLPVRKDQHYCRSWCRQHSYLRQLEGPPNSMELPEARKRVDR